MLELIMIGYLALIWIISFALYARKDEYLNCIFTSNIILTAGVIVFYLCIIFEIVDKLKIINITIHFMCISLILYVLIIVFLSFSSGFSQSGLPEDTPAYFVCLFMVIQWIVVFCVFVISAVGILALVDKGACELSKNITKASYYVAEKEYKIPEECEKKKGKGKEYDVCIKSYRSPSGKEISIKRMKVVKE